MLAASRSRVSPRSPKSPNGSVPGLWRPRARRVPKADHPVLTGRQQTPAIAGEGQCVDRSAMAAEGAPLSTAAHIPQLNLAILTGRGEQAVAACEGDRRDAAGVRPERALGTRGRGGPQP